MEHIRYGDDPAPVRRADPAAGPSKGVVVVIHGGFWRAAYDLSLGRPLAASLVEHGWTAYNLEYRRVGNGGGYPQTLDDVAAGIDALAAVEGLDTSTVMTLGHSAGGHLAVWAAGRPKLTGTPWGEPAVRVTAAISQAGVLDLHAGGPPRQRGGAGVHGRARRHHVRRPERRRSRSTCRCAASTPRPTTPCRSASRSSTSTGPGRPAGTPSSIEVEGDHFVVIDPRRRPGRGPWRSWRALASR